MGTILMILIGIIIVALIITAVSAAVAVPVFYLWNGIIPDLFQGPEVTFMQAWGLMWLVCLLFSLAGSGSGK